MNFGITIITIFYIVILIVPGIFFKRFYFQAKFANEFGKGVFADKAITSIFWGLIIQILSIFIVKFTFSLTFDEIYIRANNIYQSIHEGYLPKVSYKQLKLIFAFFIFSIAIACLCGYFLHKLIRYFRLDVTFSPLRFANEWNYIFRNEASQSIDSSLEKKKYHSTELDIIVKESKNDNPVFYSGILKDYFLDEYGQLDKIILKAAKKRVKKNQGTKEFVEIKGDTFIVPYCNIENINLRFNYTSRINSFKIPSAIVNTVYLFAILILIFIFIFPWFTNVDFWRKILSILPLFLSWTSLMIVVMVYIGSSDPKKDIAKGRNHLLFFLLSIMFMIVALLLLDLINVSKISKHVREFINMY
ncbi:hypothetical protein G5B30_16750 [Sphingobacterium sp. SGG-5]|uniref:hypothetical protein n=1 Tax=Sphingobacterium sp. SGG-5 TaxID=2710881 RepID=UPI0013EB4E0B|nr:hypothetical protein [Sphingobacterium sp. SGG-5]NGM63560.1 hypothetical protein [Sphingobacterium sp. SGG-5]